MKVYEPVAPQSKKKDDGQPSATSLGRELKEKKKSSVNRRYRRSERTFFVLERMSPRVVLDVQNHQFSDDTLASWNKKIEQYRHEFDATGKLSADFFDFE
ncbi:TPA: hypothetical protein P0E07_001185 [Vibrio fluvialis]|nr:hypothetical protein [Vibrio fluvialis]